jgi:hypothetical protein
MQSTPVIHLLDKLAYPLACVLQVSISGFAYFLLLKGSHKPLCTSVVVGITSPAHADLDVVLPQQSGVLRRCILYTAIGVVDEPFSFPVTLAKGHTQCSKRQLCLQSARQLPPDDTTRVGVENNR